MFDVCNIFDPVILRLRKMPFNLANLTSLTNLPFSILISHHVYIVFEVLGKK